ncbi:MAG: Crp/Fnr family transcriptional regulator [Gemmatimonas sp.]|nr:Crp/Fnr family transcriptional regulator [Gemmatimonadaceae bacterium]
MASSSVFLKEITRVAREQRDQIAAFGARTSWPAGFTIYEQGTTADGIFLVLRGQVVLRNQVGAGRSFVPWVATPGETFGGEGLEVSAVYASQAKAEEESETLHLSSTRFSAMLREQPATALILLRQIMAERTALLVKFGQHAMLTVEQRLIASLVRLAQSHDARAGAAVPPVPRRLLGELVGATRESISLVLGRLCAEGLVRREGGGLFISDLEKLVMRLAPANRPPMSDFEDRPSVSGGFQQEV